MINLNLGVYVLDKNRTKEIGIKHLNDISSHIEGINKWKNILLEYQFKSVYTDDVLAWLSSVLALKAVYSENLGIGSVLVDNENNVVGEGHNKVFNPYFRSDLHAEMVVLNQFEENNKDIKSVKGYTLYTSLESCPMCLTRLITSGVNTVLYVAPDKFGGMVHIRKNLPSIWHDLSENQKFGQADCSQDLINASEEIFLLNREELDKKIKMRQGY